MGNARLESVTDRYIAGVLSADEREELYWLLLSSPAAREQFDRQIEYHRISHPQAGLFSATGFLESHVPRAHGILRALVPHPLEAPARQLRPTATFPLPRPAWKYWTAGSFFAACLVAGVFFAAHRIPLSPFEVPVNRSLGPIATLQHAAEVQWLDTTNEIFVGDTFGAAELKVAAGVFQLAFKRGARLVVEGPAQLQLISDNEAFLHSGKVTAYVPEEAHGFKVTAPMLAVTDLGTEFGLRTASNAPAEVHVFSGVVQMAPPTLSSKRLTQGNAVRVRGRSVRALPANRRDFIFEDDLQMLEAEEQRQRWQQWRDAARALSSDPAVLVHYTFEAQDETTVRLANDSVNAPRSTDATIRGTWGTGRWPEKRAIGFQGSMDRIRFNMPHTLTSLTYMAWLRVDRLTSLSNAIAITERNQLGEVHWQIYRDGRVALSTRSGSTGNIDQTWDRAVSPTVFTADRLGKWTHLTSVYDSASRTIDHYLNGEFISSTPIKRPLPLKLGAVEIGNWGARASSLRSARSDYFNRYWNGAIDEFALVLRAMTPTEIREYYRRGRVAAGTVAQIGR